MSRLVGFDPETGEFLEDVVVLTKKQIANSQRYNEAKEEVESFKYWHGKDNFIMYLFSENCNMSDLKPQTATRLIYLATWLEYDGDYLTVKDGKMTREQMKSIMKLKDRTFEGFLKEITETGYLIKDGKSYRLNKEIFRKGSAELKKPLTEQRYVRIYIQHIRTLYEMTPQSKHTNLGYIFKLIPYVNCEYNIICHNPLEKDLDLIEPMTVGEFCEAIGYDKTNASRLIKIYNEITFEVDGQEYLFCGYRWSPKKQDMRFFVNPFIFYAGNDFRKVEILKLLFA